MNQNNKNSQLDSNSMDLQFSNELNEFDEKQIYLKLAKSESLANIV